MKIIQKKGSNTHTFTFESEQFNFAYADKSGSGDTDMNYADFPQKSSVRIEQNDWLRNVGYLWCALGLFQVGYAIYSGAAPRGFWIMIGLACVAWAHFTKVRYSVFQTDSGGVFVIQDKKHDQIINELNYRRKEQLLNWYGQVNLENSLENEIRKFNWLAEQKVITTEESENKIAEAEMMHKKLDIGQPGERLN